MSSSSLPEAEETTQRIIYIQQDIGGRLSDFVDPPIVCNSQDGTPQKRLYALAVRCQEHLAVKDKKTYDDLINKLLSCGRDWITDSRNASLFTQMNELVSKAITAINSSKTSKDQKDMYIVELWSIVIVKGISDISQCGELMNSIPNIRRLIQPSAAGGQSSGRPSPIETLRSNLNLNFVSSDAICAALSTNILKLIDYPIGILCARKNGKTTQYNMCQKNYICALAIFMSSINDYNFTQLLQVFKKKSGNPNINTFFMKLLDIFNLHLASHISAYIEGENLPIRIQIFIDRNFQRENEHILNIINKISSLLRESIDSDVSVETGLDILKKFSDFLTTIDETFYCYRWAYHLSVDIFKYIDKLPNNETIAGWKTSISMQEIKSATLDSAYGHDFNVASLTCITMLGKLFIDIMKKSRGALGGDDVWKIPEEIVDEDTCISKTLEENGYATVDQQSDLFIISFDSKSNYLKSKISYRLTDGIRWNIFQSIVIKQQIIVGIDFYVGQQPYVDVFSQQSLALSRTFKKIKPTESRELRQIILEELD